MIRTYSNTIRRREMDAVLTCMVDEKIGPGELNVRLIQTVKEIFKCDGAVALRSPAIALVYALRALDMPSGTKVMISALAPLWHFAALENSGFVPLVLDVDDSTALVTADAVSKGINDGGKILLLHETNGVMPDMDAIMALGVPVIEDISASAGASVFYAESDSEKKSEAADGKISGSFGAYAIMGLEERDVITAGGGAIIMAFSRREWIALKKHTDTVPSTDLLPDLNAALGWVQLKEFARNEASRKKLFEMFQRAAMGGRHKMFARDGERSTACNFPLVLNSALGDVQKYAARKDIEVRQAFENSVIANKTDELASCIHAKSLFLRTVFFPLYPRLTQSQAEKIVKVLGSLP